MIESQGVGERGAPLDNIAPILHLDASEPFSVAAVATVVEPLESQHGLWADQPALVTFRLVWTADIGHAYDVEAVRAVVTYRGGDLAIVRAQCSAHGRWNDVSVRDGRPKVWVEPGKHGMAASPQNFSLPRDILEWMCGSAAGWDGGAPASRTQFEPSPVWHREARGALRALAFTPSWEFAQTVDVSQVPALSPGEVTREARGISSRFLRRLRRPLSGVHLRVGDWSDDTEFTRVRARWEPETAWLLDGEEANDQFARARDLRKQLLICIEAADAERLGDLWRIAWRHYQSSLVLVAGSAEVVSAASRLGFHAALALEDSRLVDNVASQTAGCSWVVTQTVEQTEALRDFVQVVGPGDADIRIV